MTTDWIMIFDAHTSREELDEIITEQIEIALDAFHAQLAADHDLTAPARAALLARGETIIPSHTRAALLSGWRRLQAEAAAIAAPIH